MNLIRVKCLLMAMLIGMTSLTMQGSDDLQSMYARLQEYCDQKNFERAKEINLQIIQMVEQTRGTDNADYYKSWINMALVYEELKQYYDMVDAYENARSSIKRTLGTQNTDYLGTLAKLAGSYKALGEYDKALERLNEMLALVPKEELTGKGYAGFLTMMADCYLEAHRLDEAEEHASKALEILAELPEYENIELGNVFYTLALCHKVKGENNDAIDLFGQALHIYKLHYGTEDSRYTDVLSHIAACHSQAGFYQDAIKAGTEVLRLAENSNGTSRKQIVKYANNLATYYAEYGDNDKAFGIFQECIDRFRTEGKTDNYVYAQLLSNYGNLLYHRNQLSRAQEALQEADEVENRLNDTLSVARASIINNLAMCLSAQEKYQEALRRFEQVSEMQLRLHGEGSEDFVNALISRARCYLRLKHGDKANELADSAMNVAERHMGKYHSAYANALACKGDVYAYQKVFRKARVCYYQASEILKLMVDKNNDDYQTVIQNLLDCNVALNQLENNITICLNVLKLYHHVLGMHHHKYREALVELKKWYERLGDHVMAHKVEKDIKRVDNGDYDLEFISIYEHTTGITYY